MNNTQALFQEQPDIGTDANQMITVSHLDKHFKDFSLQDVSLYVPYGSIVGFVGENGAGKTTTIRAILNDLKINKGKIRIFGADHTKTSEDNYAWLEDVGVVMSEMKYPGYLKAKQLDLVMAGIYKTWDSKKFFHYLKEFRLPAEKKLKEFSTGMSRKLAIAVALSHSAKLLVLDEATSSLDPVIRDELLDILLDFVQDETHSVLLSSHILSDIEKVADYIIFIHDGKILMEENKDDLLYSCGIWHTTKEQAAGIERSHIIGVRKSQFSLDVMINNMPELKAAHPDYVTDPATLEDVMLYTIRGTKL